MIADRRQKNHDWYVADESGDIYNFKAGGCILAVLMDIRDELQTLNRLVGCPSCLTIPNLLRDIRRNTTKRRRNK